MNKAKLLFSSFFLLIFLFLSTQIFAAGVPAPSPSPSPASSATVSASNPGPPLGIPCGKTMCLSNEVCTTYPGETDPHCVPAPLNLEPSPLAKDWDCETILGAGQGSFPMNQKTKCWNHFTNTQTELDLYKKTCIYEPIVSYGDTRTLDSGDQPFIKCGKGDSGPGGPAAPGNIPDTCDVHMLANTDVRDAELGGYGPSASVAANFSSDFMSQNYLYSALFDKPMNLSGKVVSNPLTSQVLSTNNREAYRTYWRLMPASNQANLKSYTMNMADQKLISNIMFEYTNVGGVPKMTSFTALYNALKSQVIIFGHFPFIRVGCLTSYPVCPEYAQAQRELVPNIADLRALAKVFNVGAIFDDLINVYEALIGGFDGDLHSPYTAFVPLDFDSVRGYIVMKQGPGEKNAYDEHGLRDTLNAWRYPNGSDVSLSNASKENLPYVGAIYQGLLSPRFGMIPALQPQWIIDKYATPSAEYISDYKMGNSAADAPEVKLSVKGWLDTIVDEATAIILDPWAWLQNKFSQAITSIFSPDSTKKIGYTENPTADIVESKKLDNSKNALLDQYVNMQSCPMPVSYHLLSPKTVPLAINGDDHHQVVTIPGKQLDWSYTPKCHSLTPTYECKTDKISGREICKWETPVCHLSAETYQEGDQCCTRAWSVSGTKHGKALTVLNNPKQTDIKKAVASEPQISLYDMLLPDGAIKIPNAEIDAPIAKNTNTNGTGLDTKPDGGGSVNNPAESIMRENNLAQDSIHYLQSCWTVPKDLQNSPRCNYVFAPVASSSACSGELFAKLFPNPDTPSAKAISYFDSNIKSVISPEDIEAYTAAEQATGIPCEVFAGIHFEEGDNDPTKSLQDGSFLGGKSLKDSAIQAGQELLAKAGGSIADINTLIMAMSRYNGGGNSNCQPSSDCSFTADDRCGATISCSTSIASCTCPNPIPEPGSCRSKCGGTFPFKFDYNYCPRQSEGYDDPYVTNWWKSPEHDIMYLLYMRDCTQTRPLIHSRPGSLTVAISLFLSEK